MLPKIDPGILGSVKHEINEAWIMDMFYRIEEYDPIMSQLMCSIGKTFSIKAMGQALLVYRLLESQAEVDEMEAP